MRKVSLIGILVLTALMIGCKEKKTEEVKDEKVLINIGTAVSGEVEQIAEFTGTITPYVQNVICPSLTGRIEEIRVDVGHRVSKGQVLVVMDGTQYRQTSVQLAQLELDYQRMKAVYEASGISKQQLDLQLAELEIARESAKNLIENIELQSPINGIVTGRYYDPGDMFTMSPVDGVIGILTVMQMDRLKVEVNVSEQYFPLVKVGMPVELALDLYPNEKFPAKVSLVYPAIDPATRTFTVEITIPNGNLKLRPGMYSRTTLNFGKEERVLIPDLALQKQVGSNERFVYVVKDDSVVYRRTVQPGRQIGKQYELISGVEAGETVVTAGFSRLMDQAIVSINQ